MMGRRRKFLLIGLVLALLAAGWAFWYHVLRDPDYVEILIVRRDPAVPIPAASRMGNEGDLVPLLLTVRRSDLALLARHDATFNLVQFACDNAGRSYYGSELYLDGVPLRQFHHVAPSGSEHFVGRQGALLEREAAATGKGDRATILAIIPRAYAEGRGDDMQGQPCLRLVTSPASGHGEEGWARIPPARQTE